MKIRHITNSTHAKRRHTESGSSDSSASKSHRPASDLSAQFSDAEIIRLLDAYYDCALSDVEEEMLRRVLAATKSDRPEISAARALMGFRYKSAVKENIFAGTSESFGGTILPSGLIVPEKVRDAHKRKKHSLLAWISAGAAAAVIAGLVATGFFRSSTGPSCEGAYSFQKGDICVAYSNGETITDEEDIIALIGANLSDFEKAREDADDIFLSELGYAAETIDNMQSEIILP